jgi:exopolysaccharide biosynthesis predicted pyruvyltransferase EpsI
MPNGGNLGDCLIASATVQAFDRAGIPWAFLRGQRRSVQPSDLLVYGGGGSLVPMYAGGYACVESLYRLGAPVVVLPQTVQGHAAFWSGKGGLTVFCRDAASLAFLRGFPRIDSHLADDMAVGLDMTLDPFSTVMAFREAVAARQEPRVLEAFRGDGEATGAVRAGSFDVSIHANTCAFLAVLAGYSEIRTDRLHVAIGGGLLGIPVTLWNNANGKIRAVYETTLRERFPGIRYVDGPADEGAQNR